jgi:serine protease
MKTRDVVRLAPLGLIALMVACTGHVLDAPEAALDPTTHSNAVVSALNIVAGEAIVKFREGSNLTAQGLTTQGITAQGITAQSERQLSGGEHLLSFVLPASADSQASTLAFIEALKTRPDVEYAQPNYIYTAQATPNDSYYSLQWHYKAMNLPLAWDITTGVGSPVVAVIDTGWTNHPDLAGRRVGGYDFISSAATAKDGNGRDSDPTDVGDSGTCNGRTSGNSWHGTHVAGTIGANSNNASGVAGVNWNARILPLRVLGKCGGSTADIIDAIRWAGGLSVSGVPANANPAKVINMSLGGYSGSPCATSDPATQAAINAVTAVGVNVVVAAGNSNDDTSKYTPASCNNTVTVAASETRNYRAPYSNYGSYIDVTAPGGDTSQDRNADGYADGVLSTLPNSTGSSYSYSFYQGTSMATPHVAGLVSLMLAKTPGLTPAQVLAKLKSSATPLTSTQCSLGCGSGLVNAQKALQ